MGLLDKIRGQVVVVEEDEQAKREARDAKIAEAWAWVRRHMDEACDIYQREGDDSELRQVLTGRALDKTLTMLNHMRANACVWSYPDRATKANERLRVEEVVSRTIVMRVMFYDHSVVERYAGSQLIERIPADGHEKIVRVTMELDANGGYYVSDTTLLSAGD